MKTEYQEPNMQIMMFEKAPRTLYIESTLPGYDVETASNDDGVF